MNFDFLFFKFLGHGTNLTGNGGLRQAVHLDPILWARAIYPILGYS